MRDAASVRLVAHAHVLFGLIDAVPGNRRTKTAAASALSRIATGVSSTRSVVHAGRRPAMSNPPICSCGGDSRFGRWGAMPSCRTIAGDRNRMASVSRRPPSLVMEVIILDGGAYSTLRPSTRWGSDRQKVAEPTLSPPTFEQSVFVRDTVGIAVLCQPDREALRCYRIDTALKRDFA